MKLKILHVGNIANNAYINAKWSRENGIQADVLCYDYYHIMGTPEWEDADFDGYWKDDFNPDWGNIDLKGYQRPSWFRQGKLKEIAEKYYYYRASNLDWMTLKEPLTKNPILRKTIKAFHYYRRHFLIWQNKYYRSLFRDFKTFFPERKDRLTVSDVALFIDKIPYFDSIFKNYDLLHCYSTDPIYALLWGKKPYIAFEHGTLRDIPFENTSTGRLTALAYRKADLVMITNADNIRAARKLGLTNFISALHPIDAYWHNLYRAKNIKHDGTKFRIFSPARHDWKCKKSDYLIRAIAELPQSSQKKLEIILLNFGIDVQKSKNLIKKFGLRCSVTWKPPMQRSKLAFQMEESDIIFDQVTYHGVGGITIEGLLAGKPVLNSYDPELCRWLFPEPPPIVSVFTVKDIANAIAELVSNKAKIESISSESKKWFSNNHSKEIVIKELIKNYQKVLCSRGL